MPLVLSLLTFALFTANVSLGAISGTAILSDVGEMLVLLIATIFFVVAILKKEADQK